MFCPSSGQVPSVTPIDSYADADSLLVMVHGTPRPEANGDIIRVVHDVNLSGRFKQVQIGYMECNEPDIPNAILGMVERGAKSIVAVPYFLHTGRHVCDDLPNFLIQAQTEYPGVQFRMGNYIGTFNQVTQLLWNRTQTYLS